jgi:hypothetical protein
MDPQKLIGNKAVLIFRVTELRRKLRQNPGHDGVPEFFVPYREKAGHWVPDFFAGP